MPGRRARRGQTASRGARPRRIRRFLEPALLLLLHCDPMHGYALVEGLCDLGLESYATDMSAIYRVLYSLEERGMLVSAHDAEASGGPPRRVYTLTEAGDAFLHDWVVELRETDRVLHLFLEAYDTHQVLHRTEPDRGPFAADTNSTDG